MKYLIVLFFCVPSICFAGFNKDEVTSQLHLVSKDIFNAFLVISNDTDGFILFPVYKEKDEVLLTSEQEEFLSQIPEENVIDVYDLRRLVLVGGNGGGGGYKEFYKQSDIIEVLDLQERLVLGGNGGGGG